MPTLPQVSKIPKQGNAQPRTPHLQAPRPRFGQQVVQASQHALAVGALGIQHHWVRGADALGPAGARRLSSSKTVLLCEL